MSDSAMNAFLCLEKSSSIGGVSLVGRGGMAGGPGEVKKSDLVAAQPTRLSFPATIPRDVITRCRSTIFEDAAPIPTVVAFPESCCDTRPS